MLTDEAVLGPLLPWPPCNFTPLTYATATTGQTRLEILLTAKKLTHMTDCIHKNSLVRCFKKNILLELHRKNTGHKKELIQRSRNAVYWYLLRSSKMLWKQTHDHNLPHRFRFGAPTTKSIWFRNKGEVLTHGQNNLMILICHHLVELSKNTVIQYAEDQVRHWH